MPANRKNEVLIASIGLVGVLATGVFSNWDKMFPPANQIVTTYTGYRATGNFETELRYYFEVSGVRRAVEDMVHQTLEQQKTAALVQAPEEAEEINAIFEAVEEEAIRIDEIIPVILPVYQKHFTVEEIQELNRFYSTETMQNMVAKLPLVTADLVPHQVKMIEDYMGRVQDRIRQILSE